jgi:hypothetical protein
MIFDESDSEESIEPKYFDLRQVQSIKSFPIAETYGSEYCILHRLRVQPA